MVTQFQEEKIAPSIGGKSSTSTSIKRYILLLILAWSTTIAVSLAWNILETGHDVLAQAQSDARMAFSKDLLYRRWAAGHGGVYVPITDETPPNPYLSHINERDIVTPSRRLLTLVNPAYMTRQVFELGCEQYSMRGHITSLKPIRQENAPDPWERKALEAFERGETEIYSEEQIDGESYMRLMRPMVAEEQCLKCHAEQGYKKGEIRGGISVSVPLHPYRAGILHHSMPIIGGHVLLWLLGIAGLGFGGQSVLRRERARTLAEKELQKSEKRYRTVVEETANLIAEVDREGHYTYVNCVSERVLGVDSGQCIGLAAFDFIHPVDRDKTMKWYRECVDAGIEQASIENRLMNRETGVTTDMLWTCTFHYDDDGQPGRVCGIARDITERKQVEEELARLATVVEQAAEDIVITNTEGIILYVNPAFEQITGYSKEEVVGQNSRLLKSETHDENFYKELWSTITSGHVWTGRIKNKRKDGQLIEEGATFSPIRDPRGGIFGYVAIKRDVTEQIRMEEQLRQAHKMEAIGTLAGGIAHDFNNILGAIIGYTEIVLEQVKNREFPDEADLGEVLKAGGRAKGLVKQILAFSRQAKHEKVPVNLGSLVKEVLKLLRGALPSTIEIRQDISQENTYVQGDSSQIHQVIMNLCTNAWHAMEECGGILTVELQAVEPDEAGESSELESGSYIQLNIEDTGCGISEDKLDRIFEPFYTTKSQGKGTGMGLALVHGIVQSHGGTISVKSEVGAGTIFSVILPIVDLGLETVEAEEEAIARGMERILLVDDEEALRQIGIHILLSLGYHVTTREDGKAAYETFMADPNKFDMIITDLTMPQMTGLELAESILEIRPEIPVILSTGFSDMITPERIEEVGFRAVLQKPMSKHELACTIRRVLDQKKTGGELPTNG